MANRTSTFRARTARSAVVLSPLLAFLAAAAGCGDDDAATDGTTTSTTTSTTAAEGSTTSSSTPSSSSGPGEDLPGEPIDIHPYEGDLLGVAGVAADDTLNVRTVPGTGGEVAFELGPLATDVEATGHNRSIEGGGVWAEVTHAEGRGWANVAFLAHLGATQDVTSEIGEPPAAETMVEIGEQVAALRAGDAPEPDVTVVDGPTVGDLGEITVDVLGFADDAQRGERLARLRPTPPRRRDLPDPHRRGHPPLRPRRHRRRPLRVAGELEAIAHLTWGDYLQNKAKARSHRRRQPPAAASRNEAPPRDADPSRKAW
jgi:hypothetical protein